MQETKESSAKPMSPHHPDAYGQPLGFTLETLCYNIS